MHPGRMRLMQPPWLGLVALLFVSCLPAWADDQPPIPVSFTIDQPGYVTLVIEDAAGKRVRNLVSETYFTAGTHTAWWDGLDESGRINIWYHNIYDIEGKLVAPGSYRVRGPTRQRLDLRYEFTVYNAGTPPWYLSDRTGQWLADHTPPSDVLFLNYSAPVGTRSQVLIGSYVAESGDGFTFTDLAGRKLYGMRSLGGGGGWWGASHLARDAGPRALGGVYAYNASAWEDYLEVWEMGPNSKLLTYQFADPAQTGISGLAAHNALIVASLPKTKQLLFIDGSTRSVLGTASVPNGRRQRIRGGGAQPFQHRAGGRPGHDLAAAGDAARHGPAVGCYSST